MALKLGNLEWVGRVDWRRQLALAAATLLLLAGAFCGWQTWLIANEGHAVGQVQQAQGQAVQAVAAIIAADRLQLQRALDKIDTAALATDPASGVAALKRDVPQALDVQIYSAGLSEVVRANYHEFGYSKAAQLLDAQGAEGVTPAQSVLAGSGRRLSFALPVGPLQQPLAWVWAEFPFAPIEQAFNRIGSAGGRLELRQGDDGAGLALLAHGSGSAAVGQPAKPVPGSTFTVLATMPEAFIVLPRVWPLAALMALLGLGFGGYLLRVFARLSAAGALPEEDILVPAPVRQRAPSKPSAPPPAPELPPSEMVDRSIFRAYDVRGVVGETLSRDVAEVLGRAIGSVMRETGLREIVVGRDGRLSGTELVGALSDGLREAGVDVIDVGAVPSPVVYYAAYRLNTGCCVAVTGSHNPPDHNGFKIMVGGQTLAGEAIQSLYRRIVAGELESGGQGSLRSVDVVPDYVERIVSDVQAERMLKVVVDCGNGIAGVVAPEVLEGVGCTVVPLYCDVDGSFPNHHPDPSDPANLEDLILAVKQTDADLGVAFDGDGDRLGVVTREGEIIYPDRLLMLFARDVLSRQPGATVLYDVKCTSHLKGQILDAGGSPLMWRTGHSLIKAKMRETGAELAGEMSGHFFFKERWFGFDDGVYAAARLLEILAGDLDGRTPDEIFASCPHGESTPELKVPMADGAQHEFMARFRTQAAFPDATMVTIDGVRADWSDGWGLVRASNTTSVLVLRFEADNPAALRRIQQLFRKQLLVVEPSLKLPF